MDANVGRGMYCFSMESLIAGLPAFDASFDDGLDEASTPTENREFMFIEVSTLGIVRLLSSAPLLTEASLKEMLPTNGILFCDGGMDGGV